jgi:hypothetical protein
MRQEIYADFLWRNLLKTGGRLRRKWHDNTMKVWIGLIWHRVAPTYENDIESLCSVA